MPLGGLCFTDAACFLAGAAGGAAASYYGSSESEEEPSFENWAAVSLGTAAAAAIVTALLIEALD
jgi:hypothetical protein